ncbi:MAG TPA: S8/S53 family peptidase [Mycobacteriales bacterium]|nr:S8/S53 family peptidase [Mycobacteriales bacterium]
MHPRNASQRPAPPGGGGVRRPIRVVEGQLIAPNGVVAELAEVLGPEAPVRPLAQLTPGKAAGQSLTLVQVGGTMPTLKQLELLAAKAPSLAEVVTANYILQPWVSSGGDGLPVPSTATPPTGNFPGTGEVVLFDSGLLTSFHTGRPYLARVTAATSADLITLPGPNQVLGLFDSHGMFVSGVLACAAPGADVTVRRVFDNTGGVDDFGLATAINTYLNQHPDTMVVNLSCGTFAEPNHPPAALEQLVRAWPGVLFVAAAGNVGGGLPLLPAFPAAFEQVVGVGATNHAGQPTTFSDPLSTDVWALGGQVENAFGPGTVGFGTNKIGPFNLTANWSGTSFAAPLVAAALLEFMAAPPANQNLAVAAISWLADRYPLLNGKPVVPAPSGPVATSRHRLVARPASRG